MDRRMGAKALGIAAWGVGLLIGGGSAAAAVLGVTINDADAGDYTLTSLTVGRGSAGDFTYLPSQLIGVDVTDIAATGNSLVTRAGASVPPPGQRAALLEDMRLDTGLINPFSTGAPASDAFEVTFLTPVINSDGIDIVVFDIGSGDPTRFWIDGDRDNHAFETTAGHFDTNRLWDMPFTQYAYDNPSGGTNVNGLAALEDADGWGGAGTNGTTAVAAVGLDLTHFGVALGGSVSRLSWQTTVTGSRLDAVLVAGLPAVPDTSTPEPASLALLCGSAACLLARRGGRPGSSGF